MTQPLMPFAPSKFADDADIIVNSHSGGRVHRGAPTASRWKPAAMAGASGGIPRAGFRRKAWSKNGAISDW